MEIRRIVILPGAVLALLLSGCETPAGFGVGAPVLDSHFGEAVTRAWAMQTINPDGVTPNDQGYSGRSAHNAIERHYAPPGKEGRQAGASSQEKSAGSSGSSEKSSR